MKAFFNNILLAGVAVIMLATSCVSDDSKLGNNDLPDIVISGMNEEEALSVASYTGKNLKDLVKPTITTDYPEESLSYAWYLFNSQEKENGYRAYKIADTKEPDYEVNLPTGKYTLAFEVTNKENGYSKTATITVNTSTSFSKGFYILKETADGNTELDLFDGTTTQQDLMKGITGTSLAGKPMALSVLYNGEYIDTETNETAATTILNVTTDKNVYKGFRTEDMKEVFNNDNLFYSGTMEADEQPYLFVKSFYRNFYFSHTGVRSASAGTAMGGSPNTGKLGYPVNDGASKFVQSSSLFSGLTFWNNTQHGLYVIDYNGQAAKPVPFKDVSGNVIPDAYPSDLECLASGYSEVAKRMWFLGEQPASGQRYLLLLSTPTSITKVVRLDASLHLSKSTSVGGNGRTAAYIYSVDGGKIYAYSINNGTEIAVNLPGIPTTETPVFITNQFLHMTNFISKTYNFDNLVVGTQIGNSYKLYFYTKDELNGGIPIAEAKQVASGEGHVKSIRFVSPQTDIGGMYFSNASNPYPLSD